MFGSQSSGESRGSPIGSYMGDRYRRAVMALDPVGYWRLGESSGTVAADETGANDGTYVGTPTLGVAGALAGDSNTAVTLNGTTQRIGVPIGPWANCGARTAWAWAGWVEHTPSAAQQHLFKAYNTGGTAQVQAYSTTSGVIFKRYDGTFDTLTGPILSAAAWHLVIVSYDGSLMGVSVDGGAPTTGASTKTLDSFATGFASMGGFHSGEWFAGSLDEPAFFPRDLTASERADLYRIGIGKRP